MAGRCEEGVENGRWARARCSVSHLGLAAQQRRISTRYRFAIKRRFGAQYFLHRGETRIN